MDTDILKTEYRDIDEFLTESPDPTSELIDDFKGQAIVLNEIGCGKSTFRTLVKDSTDYQLDLATIFNGADGYIITFNGVYSSFAPNEVLKQQIQEKDLTIGLLFPSVDKKIVTYIPNPKELKETRQQMQKVQR